MDYTIWVVAAAVIAFIVGILCQRFIFSDGAEKLRMSNQLKDLRREYHEYQMKVSDHLQQTTRLISTIQTHYDEVQSHLLSAAQDLNRHEGRQNLLQPHSHYISYGDHEDTEDDTNHQDHYSEDFLKTIKTPEGHHPPKDYV